ncbi:MAG TPA: DUF1508 domain-containing protein [Acidimicrobiales bacterium]|jgi:uncharacterized protein|nr:DUF1508 domain-containing protein [Acidimicrobiales bacterium]
MSTSGYFVVYKDDAGEFRWRLRAANNEIIAVSSEGYRNKNDYEAMVDWIKENASLFNVIHV